jgi:hypothetical protein
MTVRPAPLYRWFGSLLSIVFGALILWAGQHYLLERTVPPWTLSLLVADTFVLGAGLALIAIGFMNWSSYIRADGMNVSIGNILMRRQFDKSELGSIRMVHARFARLLRFVRTDGTVAFATSGYAWGEANLGLLADYLDVPMEW